MRVRGIKLKVTISVCISYNTANVTITIIIDEAFRVTSRLHITVNSTFAHKHSTTTVFELSIPLHLNCVNTSNTTIVGLSVNVREIVF